VPFSSKKIEELLSYLCACHVSLYQLLVLFMVDLKSVMVIFAFCMLKIGMHS